MARHMHTLLSLETRTLQGKGATCARGWLEGLKLPPVWRRVLMLVASSDISLLFLSARLAGLLPCKIFLCFPCVRGGGGEGKVGWECGLV